MSHARSRSRSPVRPQDEPYVIDSRSPSMERSPSNSSQNSDKSSTLFLSNLPPLWSHERIKKFITDNTMSSQIADSLQFVFILKENNRSQGSCLVRFSNMSACKLALKQLSGIMCEGKRIIALMDTAHLKAIKLDSRYKKFEERQLSVRPPKQRMKNENTFSNTIDTSQIPSLLQPIQPPTQHQVQPNYETFGLSMEFLNALGIKLPLLNKIFIANLDPQVDESKLREVFSLAGQVLTIYMLKKKDVTRRGMAKIEFDHPVEAVQAISMLNGQELFSTKLIVQMDTSPQSITKNLPVGLNSVGPGLGPNSEPMRGVRNTVEFQPIKQLLMQEISKLKNLSANPTEQTSLASTNQPVHVDTTNVGLLNNSGLNVQNPMAAMNVNAINPFNQTTSLVGMNPLLNTQATQNVQILQGLLQQGVSADLAVTLAALQTQNLTQNMSGLSQNATGLNQNIAGVTQNVTGFTQNAPSLSQSMGQSQNEWKLQGQSTPSNISSGFQNLTDFNGSDSSYNYNRSQSNYDSSRRSFNDSYSNTKDNIQMEMDSHKQQLKDSDDSNRNIKSSDMLVFNNLPPSVTVLALSTKMREVGELKFAEMTGHGRAIVRFMNVQDAERCVKLFNRSKVDGQPIEVKFF